MIQLTRAMRPKLPTLGLKLNTAYESCFSSVSNKYRNETNSNLYKIIKCKYCGLITIKYFGFNSKKPQFCSNACVTKYFGQLKAKNCLKSAIRIVNNSELKTFLKEYSNFVYSEIYNYPSEVREDLIDFWNEKSITILANIKKSKIDKKGFIMKYLKKCIKYAALNLIKNKQKEVFYDELGYYNYSRILGEDKRERY